MTEPPLDDLPTSKGPGANDAAAVRLFPPVVPLIAILAGVVLQRWVPLRIGSAIALAVRLWVGGAVAISAVVLLGVWPVLLYRRTGQDPNPRKPTPVVIDRGPFRLTRNPMYLQFVFVCVGVAIMLANAWVLIFIALGAWLLHRFVILPEEMYLEQKFGESYLAYKRRVRRWL